MNIDSSKDEFKKFLKDFENLKNFDISESDTRSKVIDRIFINVLNWREEDIQREGHIDSGYFDYKFSLPGFHLIVEAKKQYINFNLPINTKKVSISTIYKENEEVINQIRNYTSDSGIDYGIITNGHQFIIGQFVNHNGKPWKNNQVLIFNGFDDINDRYVEFYNNISKSSIIHNGTFSFITVNEIENPKKIISTLIDREKEIVRNTISSQIAPLIDIIFGEIFNDNIEDDKEFINECFVENKETIKNKIELSSLFDDTPPDLEEVVKARNLTNIAHQISDEIIKTPIVAKESAPPKPIIIVGSKGAGKTTFINYLFRNKLSEDTLKDHPFVYVDFIKYYKEDKTIDTELISSDILDVIYEDYEYLKLHSSSVLKRIYYKEIKRNDESIWEDLKAKDISAYERKMNEFFEIKTQQKQRHLELLSKYLIRERRLRLIIIIDNADQFDFNVQEKVFLFANSLNRSAFCGVFISLREGYYYKWRYKPPFNAFASNVYHVTAPPYSEVLQRRIDFTLKKIEVSDKVIGVNEKGHKIIIDNQNIVEFLHSLQDSLFDENNQSIIDFLNYSTFPNIREGLNLFKLFLVSGYTDVHEYILRVRFNPNDKKITIPIHEFVKSIGLSNKLYYNSEISVISNLFYPCPKCSDHFLKIWILKYFQEKLEVGGNISKFERYSKLIEDFVDFGYKIDILNQTISEMLSQELIDSDEILTDMKWYELPNKDFNISISPKGFYYIKELKNRFHYLDMVLQDTPIYDNNSFKKIKSVFPVANENGKRNLSERISTILEFLSYLKLQESKQSTELKRKYGSIVDEIVTNGLNADLERINKKQPPTRG
jgi:Cdc6-like AAA superfamily ATPase